MQTVDVHGLFSIKVAYTQAPSNTVQKAVGIHTAFQDVRAADRVSNRGRWGGECEKGFPS